MNDIFIETDEISKFIFTELRDGGHNTDIETINIFTDIMFDFLVYKGIIEEE